MDPTAMALYAAILSRGYAVRDGIDIQAQRKDDAVEIPVAARTRSTGGAVGKGNIAVIQVFGSIVQRASQLGPCEGGTGTEDVGNALSMALADDTVSQIILEVDSPGGSVFGVAELGAQIAAASKPVIGLANSMAASAGYWLLSQCSEAYCTPGGMVGSIGVYGAHQDISKALEDAGIKMTLVSAGKFKVEGSPYSPLDPDALAAMQESIDSYYSMFVSAVAKGRNVGVSTVRDGMGQGRVLQASDALKAGMIDGIATFSDVVKKMSRAQQQQGSSRSALAAARNELELLA